MCRKKGINKKCQDIFSGMRVVCFAQGFESIVLWIIGQSMEVGGKGYGCLQPSPTMTLHNIVTIAKNTGYPIL